MLKCVCGEIAEVKSPVTLELGVALASNSNEIGQDIVLLQCDACGHVSLNSSIDEIKFYSSEYRLLLESNEVDNVVEVRNGSLVRRSTRQAELVADLHVIRGRALDYGSGKGLTSRELGRLCPLLQRFVFDVSDDYQSSWSDLVPDATTAVGEIPESWIETMDIVSSFFVLEHIRDPLIETTRMFDLLKSTGVLIGCVPDADTNVGDYLVADHLHHYSPRSLQQLLLRTGFSQVSVGRDTVLAALVFTAVKTRNLESVSPDVSVSEDRPKNRLLEAKMMERGLMRFIRTSSAVALQRTGDFAIYGAGFYGELLAVLLGQPSLFFDRNPYLTRSRAGRQIERPRVVSPPPGALLVAVSPRVSTEVEFRRKMSELGIPTVFYPFESIGAE
jgi:SAM-dependent methyltransferase